MNLQLVLLCILIAHLLEIVWGQRRRPVRELRFHPYHYVRVSAYLDDEIVGDHYIRRGYYHIANGNESEPELPELGIEDGGSENMDSRRRLATPELARGSMEVEVIEETEDEEDHADEQDVRMHGSTQSSPDPLEEW